MKEAILQSLQNLRANKLRSVLTMFGIAWGMISVVILSATGEGFRLGNEKVLRELGKNIAIVCIPTIELECGRHFTWQDEEQVSRVAIAGSDMAEQLFGKRHIVGESITLNGLPYTVVGKIRKKNQDSNYSGPDNNKIFVPFGAMSRDLPRTDAEPGTLSNIILAPKPPVVADLPRVLDQRTGRIEDIDWPLQRDVRALLARRHDFDPEDREAIQMWGYLAGNAHVRSNDRSHASRTLSSG